MAYYEMRTYTLKPGTLNQYMELFNKEGAPIITKYLPMAGYFYREVGSCLNQIIHIWRYETQDQRMELRKALYQDEVWTKEFLPKLMPFVEKQENTILIPFECSPLK
jgi:hypothetical protein